MIMGRTWNQGLRIGLAGVALAAAAGWACGSSEGDNGAGASGAQATFNDKVYLTSPAVAGAFDRNGYEVAMHCAACRDDNPPGSAAPGRRRRISDRDPPQPTGGDGSRSSTTIATPGRATSSMPSPRRAIAVLA